MQKKQKVLMFGWEFPPEISGGLGTACYGLVSGLIENNMDVLFVVPKLYGKEDKSKFRLIGANDIEVDFTHERFQQNISKATYMQINSNLIPYQTPEEYFELKSKQHIDYQSIFNQQKAQFTFQGNYGPSLMDEVYNYSLVAMQIAADNDFDIIHAHDWLTFPAGILAKEISGKPLVVHVHATEFDRSGENVNQQVYEMEKRGVHAADRVICVSRLTRRILIERYDVDPSKVFVVHNAVVPREKTIYPEKTIKHKNIVTFLGRITFQKGPDYFVEAAKKVIEILPDTHFVMAGKGDMYTGLIERVAELRISNRFHFTGFLNHFETNSLYGMSDIYIMPSVSEPFGITPLEAMRTGIPVIISKQSGVSEVLKNAIKVDFWDVNALANCIIGLLHNKDLAKKLAVEGAKEVENMKWEYAALRVKEAYQDLLQ